mmetsp:Transcript_8070/g.17547  ORF Transcript_8070/g.17547 Transcript_8070/m.17547 type:complete len:203 (-) Transcript_8070:765-1373(-)
MSWTQRRRLQVGPVPLRKSPDKLANLATAGDWQAGSLHYVASVPSPPTPPLGTEEDHSRRWPLPRVLLSMSEFQGRPRPRPPRLLRRQRLRQGHLRCSLISSEAPLGLQQLLRSPASKTPRRHHAPASLGSLCPGLRSLHLQRAQGACHHHHHLGEVYHQELPRPWVTHFRLLRGRTPLHLRGFLCPLEQHLRPRGHPRRHK